MHVNKSYAKELAICFIYQLPVEWMGVAPDKDMISRTIDRQPEETREEFRALINQYAKEVKSSLESPAERAAYLDELSSLQAVQRVY